LLKDISPALKRVAVTMVIGCTENSSGEIAVSNARQLVDLASSSDAIVVGPGMLDEQTAGKLCSKLLEEVSGPAFVLDASAFTGLRDVELPEGRSRRIVCTPHFGEMAKFLKWDLERVESQPLAAAREAARAIQAVLAMVRFRRHARGDSRRLAGEGGHPLRCRRLGRVHARRSWPTFGRSPWGARGSRPRDTC
jgi:hypothetical protein